MQDARLLGFFLAIGRFWFCTVAESLDAGNPWGKVKPFGLYGEF